MPENVTEQKTSQESSHEGFAGHPLDHSADVAPARQLTRPGDSSPATPTDGKRSMAPPPLQLAESGGSSLPADLQRGIEAVLGVSMAGVRVIYGSSEPARFGAAAFARKGVIHLGPGQEQCLDHEAAHIGHQRLGMVRASGKRAGMPVNEDASLEAAADQVGAQARQHKAGGPSAEAASALKTGQDVDVMQFAPADFAGHAVLQEPAKTGWGRTSLWQPLCTAVTAYSVIDPLDMKGRLKLLREIGVFLNRWEIARGMPAKSINDLDPEEQRKAVALINLRTTLTDEYIALGASNGDLNVGPPDVQDVSPDPELTTVRKESDGRTRGYFLQGAQIKNAQNATIANPVTGTLCRLTKTTTAPTGTQAANYFAVRPAPNSDQVFGLVAPFPSGYVLKTEVNSVGLDTPATHLQYEDRSDPVTHPLFQAPPSVDDVEQHGLGDCYLMAALLTLIRHHPAHITNHMIDHGNGVVSVRLYESAGDNFVPKVVHVRKSVVVKKGAKTTLEEGYNKGAIWVQLLEKAYIAAGFSGECIETLPTTKMQWSQAASGGARVALGHLVGQAATRTQIHSGDPSPVRHSYFWASANNHALNAHLEQNCREDYMNYIDLDRNNVGLIKNLDRMTKLNDEVRLEDVKEVLDETEHLTEDLVSAIMAWLQQENIYPGGKRGKAMYSQSQKEAFDAVMTAVRANQMIVAGSKDHMKRGNNNRDGSSGGENVHNGLAGPHAYEVIDFSMQPGLDDINVPAPDTICWIQLRNPWGKTGRVYKDVDNNTDMTQNDHAPVVGKMEDRETEDAEFWIPLEDFTKRFDVLTTL